MKMKKAKKLIAEKWTAELQMKAKPINSLRNKSKTNSISVHKKVSQN